MRLPESSALLELRGRDPTAVIFDDTAASTVVDSDMNRVGTCVQSILDQFHHDSVQVRDGDGGLDLRHHVRGEGLDACLLRSHGRDLAIQLASRLGSRSHMLVWQGAMSTG